MFNEAIINAYIVKVCWGRVLKIFRPEELMAMVVGNEEYDWKALELNCEYKNGYSVSDDTVCYASLIVRKSLKYPIIHRLNGFGKLFMK